MNFENFLYLQNGLAILPNPLLLIRPASISTALSICCRPSVCRRFSYNACSLPYNLFLIASLRNVHGVFRFIHTIMHICMCLCVFACVLLVPTLLCMMRHTKGLLRYLYSTNYPTVDCIFHLYFSLEYSRRL